jgi:hypothetical protein
MRVHLRALVLCGLIAGSCAAPTTTSPPSTISPSPTAAAITSSPSVRPTTSPTGAARPGIISRIGDQPIVVRSETDATPIRTVPSFLFSSDGSRVTYWTENAGAAELRVLEIGGSDRIVATFRDRRPGGIAWSADGTGLLVSLVEPPDTRARVLMAVEIASGASREVYRGTGPSGASVMPLAWRRSPEVFAAYETGPGGYSFGYTVIRPGQTPVRTDPDTSVLGMAASSDGALVSGLWLFEGGGVIKVWPVDDFSKKTELKVPADERIGQQYWWPDRNEIAFQAWRPADGMSRDRRIERWDPVSGARVVLTRLADDLQPGAFLVRADGSGLLILGPYPPGAWEVRDLGTGTTTKVPQMPGENILRTVLLR